MPKDQKLPHGLHRFYTSDKFTDSVFWFMCGMVYGGGKEIYCAANTFREFLGIDEESAPTRQLVQKFNRQLKNFKEAIAEDRHKIDLKEEDDVYFNDLVDAVIRRIEQSNS